MFGANRKWISVDRTQLPFPPRSTVLTLREVSPQRFDVSFPVETRTLTFGIAFLLWVPLMLPLMIGAVVLAARFPQINVLIWMAGAFFTPMWIARLIARRFRRPDGGRLCLDRKQLSAAGGTVLLWLREYPLAETSMFALVATNDSDDARSWLLNLKGPVREVTVSDDCALNAPDLRWLHERFNEWLGWEFPAHCVACGARLAQCDLNWPKRRVECGRCGFRGPAPNPFPPEAIPAPPPAACPNCAEKIWLTHVNRASGGCRCEACGWESESAPPMHPCDFSGIVSYCASVVGRSIASRMQSSPHRASREDLLAEFPTPESAWARLAHENLLVREQDRAPQVVYRNWQTRGLPAALAAGALGIIVSALLLATVFAGPSQDRTTLESLAVCACRLVCLVLAVYLMAGVWWARRRTVLVFAPQALAWDRGGRRRVVTWHTLTDAATQRSGWPPILILVHGGAGILFAAPTVSSARAICRLCLAHCEQHGSHLASPVLRC
jgi:hypothetical protein